MILVRKATLRDIPLVISLWKEFVKEHDMMVTDRNKKLITYVHKKLNAADMWRVFIKKQLKSKKGTVFLAQVDGTAAGFILVLVKDEIPIFKIEKMGYVSDLFVKKEFRGLGISSKLCDRAMKWLGQKGLKHVSIGLYVDNEFAHSVYKKFGFFDYKLEMRRRI